ncbi:hypothetical protein BC828DRAFT_381336 [Blastocladiella britannica]|nr:hypothetical protein BC828DRAFT_381336 [Blastocladiella britannica]
MSVDFSLKFSIIFFIIHKKAMRTLADYQLVAVQVIGWGSMALGFVCAYLTIKYSRKLRSKWFSAATLLTILTFLVSDLGLVLAGNQLLAPTAAELMRSTLETISLWLICWLSCYRVRVCLRASLNGTRRSNLHASTAIVVGTLILGILSTGISVATIAIEARDPTHGSTFFLVRKYLLLESGIVCTLFNLFTAGTMFYKILLIRRRVLVCHDSSLPEAGSMGNASSATSGGGGGGGGSAISGTSHHHLHPNHRQQQQLSVSHSSKIPESLSISIVGSAHNLAPMAVDGSSNNPGASPVRGSMFLSVSSPIPKSPTKRTTNPTTRRAALMRHISQTLAVLVILVLLVIGDVGLYGSTTTMVPSMLSGTVLRLYMFFNILLWQLVVGLYKL